GDPARGAETKCPDQRATHSDAGQRIGVARSLLEVPRDGQSAGDARLGTGAGPEGGQRGGVRVCCCQRGWEQMRIRYITTENVSGDPGSNISVERFQGLSGAGAALLEAG